MIEPVYRLTRAAVVWATDGGETLALDLIKGGYVGVNTSGTLLWHALESGATRRQMVCSLRDTYGLDSGPADADVAAFLAACEARGFLAH